MIRVGRRERSRLQWRNGTPMTEPNHPIAGLSAIADRYDGYILDLWGTIHNGVEPLPGAVDCLRALAEQGKRVLILSNAPRRTGAVIDRMDAVGIPRDCYGPVLSSGEAGWLALHDRGDPWHAALGDRAFLIGEAGDESVLQDQPVEEVDSVERATFLLCVGAYARTDTVDDYADLLAAALAHNLPMLCVNPDLEVLRGPKREICAGAIAARYAALGGAVGYHGKPHRPIYELSFGLIPGVEPARILAVGDSLRTDIAGANAVGIDSLFVTGGLLAEELGIAPLGDPPAGALAALYARHGQRPSWAIAAFRW